MRRFLIALQFLTRFPVKVTPVPEPEEIGASMSYFPVAGLCIGIYLVFLNYILKLLLLPTVLLDIILVLGLVLITGAMHLDGLADTVDGFYAGNKFPPGPERKAGILTVMKDSQIGVMGCVAVFFLLLLKIFALHSLLPGVKNAVLLLVPVLSRWFLVWAAAVSDYANSPADGLGKTFTQSINEDDLIKSAPLPVFLPLLILGLKGFIILILSIFIAYILIKYFKSRVGGMTGDTFGALSEITEASVLLLAIIFFGCLG